MSAHDSDRNPPPGNSDATGDLFFLHDRLGSLARQWGAASGWRVPEEAADQIYDEAVDRILQRDAPNQVKSWACSALGKLLSRGPRRCEPGRRMRSLDELAQQPPCERIVDMKVWIQPEAREKYTRMASSFRSILSERQAEVFARLGECRSMSALAKSVGMDRRDCLRILARLEEKCGRIREILLDSCHPPAPMG